MPSKAELRTEALALGKELGVSVSVEAKNHIELTALVGELNATKAARPQPAVTPAAAPEAVAPATAATPEVVAEVPAAVVQEPVAPAVAEVVPPATAAPEPAAPVVAVEAAPAPPTAPEPPVAPVAPATAATRRAPVPTTADKVEPTAQGVKFGYSVAKGRSITSPRGILDQGAEVRATDFSADALKRLCVLGAVVRGSKQ